MKKAIFAIAIFAITLASCGTGNENKTECNNGNCDSTAVQVDTVNGDSTSTDTTIVK